MLAVILNDRNGLQASRSVFSISITLAATLSLSMATNYTPKKGNITGDNNYVSLASITVHYILLPIAGELHQNFSVDSSMAQFG